MNSSGSESETKVCERRPEGLIVIDFRSRAKVESHGEHVHLEVQSLSQPTHKIPGQGGRFAWAAVISQSDVTVKLPEVASAQLHSRDGSEISSSWTAGNLGTLEALEATTPPPDSLPRQELTVRAHASRHCMHVGEMLFESET